jgi:hypothetical protein
MGVNAKGGNGGRGGAGVGAFSCAALVFERVWGPASELVAA